MIEAATRLKGVERLIDREQYFVIHAARQSGKTTYLKDLAERLNRDAKYYTLYCSLEGMQEIGDSEKGVPEIVRKIREMLRFSSIPQKEEFAKNADYNHFTGVLFSELALFCMALDKPLVILFDEVDCLCEGTLNSFLRQLREGFINRDTIPFVQSIALVGMRKIRDYKAKIRPDSQTFGSASPFNIVEETYKLKNFTGEEIASLYRQHTDATGQLFEQDAIDLINEQTCGQPWLVNAVAKEVIDEMFDSDYTQSVTAEAVKTAIQTIILRRDTHIDSLLERLKEERVRSVIEPMICGEAIPDLLSDDFQYAIDLGLIKDENYKIQPANPIYAEVIIRTLSYGAQRKLTDEKPDYTIPRYLKDGKMDISHLLTDFQQFWRENSAIWIEMMQYKEAAPHLILQGFLQRVVNGGGHVIREMAAGLGRLDLGVVYENRTYPIEVKLWKGEQYYRKSLEQTAGYADVFGGREGWLVIFNRSAGMSWEEKIYYRQETVGGTVIHVFGN